MSKSGKLLFKSLYEKLQPNEAVLGEFFVGFNGDWRIIFNSEGVPMLVTNRRLMLDGLFYSREVALKDIVSIESFEILSKIPAIRIILPQGSFEIGPRDPSTKERRDEILQTIQKAMEMQ